MKWTIITILAALVSLGVLYVSKNSNSNGITSVQGDTCSQKDFCLVVYLAPWCPHCRNAVSSTQDMLKRTSSGKFGVRVVVGMGRDPKENADFATQIAPGVQIDRDMKIARDLGVQSVPAYRVLDKEGTQILGDEEAYAWMHEKFR